MTLPDPRLHAAMQAAVQKIVNTASSTASRVVDALGMLALSAKSNAQRQSYMSAQFDLQHKLSAFNMTFTSVLNEKVAQEITPRVGGGRSLASTDWTSLSLVGDHEVEEEVTAHRLGLDIEHECEWELRELDAYMGSLLGLGRPDPERNPVRPDVIGKALFRSIEVVSPEAAVRQTLARELGHGLAKAMRQCYGAIVADLSARGIQPVGLAVRSAVISGTGGVTAPAVPFRHSGAGSLADPHQAAQALSALFGMPAPAGFGPSGAGSLGSPSPSRTGGVSLGGATSAGAVGGPSGAGALGGPVSAGAPLASDAQMLDVIRRLAYLTSGPGALDAVSTGGWGSSGAAAAPAASAPEGLHSGLSGLMAVNLIRAHREELMRASSGALDHMVIDIVASLFDQILSDPKVPPQMARQIARLQLPVLRVALKDMQFFSSRSHPVRKFVNRMASIACAFEDFDEGPGRRFLSLVRELVQQIVEGDFDQMDLYEGKLRALEAFVQEQAHDEALAHAEAVALLANKEAQLRIVHRHEMQVQGVLASIDLPEFIRDFLVKVWTQVEVEATVRHGPDAETTRRIRRVGRELVMSLQPKATPAERKQFILALPQLMKTLHEGLALIHHPEEQKKAFFAELLPLHAQSLKGQPLTDFQLRQLDAQLQGLDRLVVPTAEEVPPTEATAAAAIPETNFSPDEAQRVGLVAETAIDWDGQLDIDLGSAPAGGTDVDINLEELEPEMRPEQPTQGVALVQHVQPGVAYQMHLDGQWKKVRLNWVSPGRTFFIFSHGKKHQTLVSMTGRMLTKMCETGRFRAFEQAYLIERAVARARKQLAELTANSQR
ncbi:DUF1631 family protein [Caldimonas manganoxidans]|uniref:DUF1631 family protein n=1 Tax=Caldimonas manganoxidans TaxID=196015 RepID=UPI00035EFDAB|nr:DUF1631 family protein [Caldimonas manganoxidans]